MDATDVTSGQRRHINNGFLTLAAFRADKVRNRKLIDKILNFRYFYTESRWHAVMTASCVPTADHPTPECRRRTTPRRSLAYTRLASLHHSLIHSHRPISRLHTCCRRSSLPTMPRSRYATMRRLHAAASGTRSSGSSPIAQSPSCTCVPIPPSRPHSPSTVVHYDPSPPTHVRSCYPDNSTLGCPDTPPTPRRPGTPTP